MKSRGNERLADTKGWMAVASGEARLALKPVKDALRLDFDFNGGGGFVVARKEVVRKAMPETFEIRFKLRGQGPRNHLELKLVDATGKNVWRYTRKDFALPRTWRELVVTSQELEFAWGPAGGGAIPNLGAVELALVAGPGGGGEVVMKEWQMEDQSFASRPAIDASSAARGHGKSAVLDGRAETFWEAAAGDARPWIALDSKSARVLGGLIVEWEAQAPARGFAVRGSNDGRRWRLLYQAARAGGSRSFVCLPRTKTRHLKLELIGPSGIRAMRVQGFEFSRSTEAFFHAVAAMSPRGWFPRWLVREQSLWTPAGGVMQRSCALLNEQGMVEPDEGSFSIEPFVSLGGRLHTWADVRIERGLLDGWMPVPWVSWEGKGWRLVVRLLAGGTQVNYKMANLSGKTLKMRLHVALRPFQVTPPWQHFRNVGGVSPIHDMVWKDKAAVVNGTHTVRPLKGEARFGAMSFDEGLLCEMLSQDTTPRHLELHDARGQATGLLSFDFSLKPGSAEEAVLEISSIRNPQSEIRNEKAERALWMERLPHTQLAGNGWAREAIQAQLTATAHVLLTQSGAALQPGPRRYTRSWIRDGTTMSAALLRMGRAKEVRAFIEWYAPFQRADGFVPCCVDRDGVDWLVEHDSHGQLLALIREDHRFTKDDAFLARMWPVVRRTVAFLEKLREKDGLLPVSVSHEGYLAQPVHSFWDDFWTLRGLRDAAQMAVILGKTRHAVRWQKLAETTARAVFTAVEATRQARKLDYIPASREWADFDPTATANALMILDVPPELNAGALHWTFNKYLEDWRKKRSGELPWSNYTAYEIRIISALVRLGRREAALELLKFFLADRRPREWNQWPEISWADPLSPGHVGDVPHTWIAAEYVLAVRSLFAYESEAGGALVLAAGVPLEWLEGEGARVQRLPTWHGPLSYRLRRKGKAGVVFEVEGGIEVPPGGLLLKPPLPGPVKRVTANGVRVAADAEVVLKEVPAQVAFETDLA